MLDTSDVSCLTILIQLVVSFPDNLCVACSLSLVHHNEVAMHAGYDYQPITHHHPSRDDPEQSSTRGHYLFCGRQQTPNQINNLQLPDLSEAESTKLIS